MNKIPELFKPIKKGTYSLVSNPSSHKLERTYKCRIACSNCLMKNKNKLNGEYDGQPLALFPLNWKMKVKQQLNKSILRTLQKVLKPLLPLF